MQDQRRIKSGQDKPTEKNIPPRKSDSSKEAQSIRPNQKTQPGTGVDDKDTKRGSIKSSRTRDKTSESETRKGTRVQETTQRKTTTHPETATATRKGQP